MPPTERVRARPSARRVVPATDGHRRKRLKAEERRPLILEAARKAFSETGNMSAATIKRIAFAAGISEGIIYRHFDSKEDLFFEAIVEPLEDSIAAMVEISFGTAVGITAAEQRKLCRQMYSRLISAFSDILPLFGLVLFGDPIVARQFYRDTFTPAVQRLSELWRDFYGQYGITVPAQTMAEGILGISVMYAIKARHDPSFNLRQASEELTQLTLGGFFPSHPGIVDEPKPTRRK